MAVFTAVATAIVQAVVSKAFVATLLGKIVVGVVATGLMAGTAKLLGLYEPPTQGKRKDPGVKVQLPPATDNKVPKLYGRNYTGSIIIDAEIKNQNQTMAYAMVIGEYTDGETWTINDIYRGDARLIFSGATVQSQIDPNSTSRTDVQGKMRCRVYAGGSEAQHQIFPTTGAVPAYGTGSGQFLSWSSANTMEGLVFAVFEMDYDAENGLTGLDAITYDINNSVNNPGDVLEDYLTNTRYGAGLDPGLIDTDSIDALRQFSNDQVDYEDQSGNTQTHKRYQIDGALSTFNSHKENINSLCQACGSFFTYNTIKGQFGVVLNRAATQSEKDEAYLFSDDNIVSAITITDTDLFDLYNAVEVEYPSVNRRDQTDTFFAEVPQNIRNTNEPTNVLQYRVDMANDRARVAQLAITDLNQSRISKVIEATLDITGMQLVVGDIVKLTSELYGYEDKLFRVMRLVEQEDGEGVISVKALLLEYIDAVYDDILTQEDLPEPVSGISNFYAIQELQDETNVAIANTVIGGFTGPNANSFVGTVPSSVVAGLDQELANLNVDLDDAANAINELTTVTLPDLNDDLNVAQGEINTLNNTTIPNLQNDLNQLDSNLSVAESEINTLNTTTIPNLQDELDQIDTDFSNIFPITETDISDDAISTPKLQTNAVKAGKIDAGAVTAREILAGTITALEIDTATITANEIAFGTITGNRIDTGTITAQNIGTGTITALEIAGNTITANNIAFGTITGDRIQGNTITANQIAANTITANNIAFGTITGDQIQANSITANEISAANLSAISTSTGDLFVDRIRTAEAPNQRIDITGPQVDSTFAIWSGSGPVKNINTATFAIEHDGDAKFGGRVRAAQLEGAIMDAVPIDLVGDLVENTSNVTYKTVADRIVEIPAVIERPRRPFVTLAVPIFGNPANDSNGAWVEAEVAIEDQFGNYGPWLPIIQEYTVDTTTIGSAVVVSGGRLETGNYGFRVRVRFRSFFSGEGTRTNRFTGVFMGLPAGNGLNIIKDSTGTTTSSESPLPDSIYEPPNFNTGWDQP